jgi:hypothetical protein
MSAGPAFHRVGFAAMRLITRAEFNRAVNRHPPQRRAWPSPWQRLVFRIIANWLKRNGYAFEHAPGKWEVTWEEDAADEEAF